MPVRTLATDERAIWEPRLTRGDSEPPRGVGTSRSEGLGVSEFQSSWIVHIVQGESRVRAGLPRDAPSVTRVDADDRPRSRIVIIAMPAGAAGWPVRAFYWQGTVSAPLMTGLRPNPDAPGADPSEPTSGSLRKQGVIVPALGERVSGRWYQNLATFLHVRRPLPIAPLWPGVAINGAFWGLVLVLAMRGPAALRRWARSRRGACLNCGYALTAGTAASTEGPGTMCICPECGTPTTRAASARESAQPA